MSNSLLAQMWLAAGGDAGALKRLAVTGEGALPSAFAVTDLGVASIGAASLATAELVAVGGNEPPAITIDRRLASFWLKSSIRPRGWTIPPPWDPIAGDYRGADGWIRLHTNAPHHREAALAVLGVTAVREEVARAVATWKADELEAAVVGQGGCAATMRSVDAWAEHPQGRAVAAEPLLIRGAGDAAAAAPWPISRDRPLKGIRVLDLTRVLAGPVATRFLAGYGALVLRIDPPDWDEPGVVPDVVPGKRCARLDLRDPDGRARLEDLLRQTDILVHGYRPDALERLGLGIARRRELRPGLVDVCLDAYGWSGPWAGRRGFDSLVQMSAGIAEAGMRWAGADRPVPLPAQALDHATGYLMAAAAIRGLTIRLAEGRGSRWRASLARMAALLTGATADHSAYEPAPEIEADLADVIEHTGWGPARRLRPPVTIEGAPMRWSRPAGPLGGDQPSWWSSI